MPQFLLFLRYFLIFFSIKCYVYYINAELAVQCVYSSQNIFSAVTSPVLRNRVYCVLL